MEAKQREGVENVIKKGSIKCRDLQDYRMQGSNNVGGAPLSPRPTGVHTSVWCTAGRMATSRLRWGKP